ncbi:MAG: beta-N-acetylhexosaminidase, partial [Clostridia bacterium]|nr:beta-N-acetylhexosaminidase [Clostridia bacterium]
DGLFEMSYHAAHVLALKAEMGIILTKAYRNNDKETLKHYADFELPELRKRVEALRMSHMTNWFKIYKPLGWDVMDLRYGGLLSRIDTTIYEINAYLNGEFDRLEEFEQERLPFDGVEGPIRYMNLWERLASPSKIVAKI